MVTYTLVSAFTFSRERALLQLIVAVEELAKLLSQPTQL